MIFSQNPHALKCPCRTQIFFDSDTRKSHVSELRLSLTSTQKRKPHDAGSCSHVITLATLLKNGECFKFRGSTIVNNRLCRVL